MEKKVRIPSWSSTLWTGPLPLISHHSATQRVCIMACPVHPISKLSPAKARIKGQRTHRFLPILSFTLCSSSVSSYVRSSDQTRPNRIHVEFIPQFHAVP